MSLLAIKLLVDFFMIVLLGAVIFYCLMVSRKIRILQDSREDFAQLIAQFDQTTQNAQKSIEELQKMADKVTDSLNERLDKANFLADDLAFMIEKGNKVADKVDGVLPKEERMGSSPLPPKREPSIGRGRKQGQGEDGKKKPSRSEHTNSVLEQLAKGEKDEDKKSSRTLKPSVRRTSRAGSRLRSRAEQELQDALKSGQED